MSGVVTRRAFLAAAAAAAGTQGLGAAAPVPAAGRVAVFLADLHVRAGDSYQKARLARVIDSILAMRPLPTNAVVFGDIAYQCGLPAEYAESRPLLRRLADAGIELSFGLGNHDRRRAFLEAWPECREQTLLPGHLVTRTDLGPVDLLMLDGLQGRDDRPAHDMGPVSGALSIAHQEWLIAELRRLKKPTFVASHYTIGNRFCLGEMDLFGRPLAETLMKFPLVIGYIHGHSHLWQPDWYHDGWGPNAREFRTASLPSTGHWGDIGYAVFTAQPGHAELRLVQDDYYFPSPRPEAERPRTWQAIVNEHRGRSVSWDW